MRVYWFLKQLSLDVCSYRLFPSFISSNCWHHSFEAYFSLPSSSRIDAYVMWEFWRHMYGKCSCMVFAQMLRRLRCLNRRLETLRSARKARLWSPNRMNELRYWFSSTISVFDGWKVIVSLLRLSTSVRVYKKIPRSIILLPFSTTIFSFLITRLIFDILSKYLQVASRVCYNISKLSRALWLLLSYVTGFYWITDHAMNFGLGLDVSSSIWHVWKDLVLSEVYIFVHGIFRISAKLQFRGYFEVHLDIAT